ncbi:MAG: hypothetical protein Q4A83_01010 [Bacillota bacterium]|nr:hypothetical protein [Bacillota bacterium]
MKIAHSIFQRFGEDITVNGASAKGFISPIAPQKHDNIKKPTAVGILNGAEYLLITECAMSACGGEEVIHRGKRFSALRAEPIFYCGGISHYEAVLRKKGGAADV